MSLKAWTDANDSSLGAIRTTSPVYSTSPQLMAANYSDHGALLTVLSMSIVDPDMPFAASPAFCVPELYDPVSDMHLIFSKTLGSLLLCTRQALVPDI